MQRVGRLDQNQLSERCRRFRLRLTELNSKLYAVDPTAGTLFAVLEANGSMLDGYTTLEGTLQTGLGAQGAQRRERGMQLLAYLHDLGQIDHALYDDALYFLTHDEFARTADGIFFVLALESKPQAAGIAAAAAQAPAAAAAAGAGFAHWRCLLALLTLLLLLLLLFLLWWFKLKPWPFAEEPAAPAAAEPPAAAVPVEPRPVPAEPAPVEPEPVPAEPAEPEPVPAEPKPAPATEPESVAAVPEPAPAPAPDPKPEPVKPVKVEKPAPAKPAKKALPKCSTLKQQQRLPSLVMGIDGSASMLVKDLQGGGAVSRLEAAHEAAIELTAKIDKSVSIGLVEINKCSIAINHGYFNAAGRGELLRRINNVVPKGSGTALVSGLIQMGNMVNPKAESVGILLSDGLDTCMRTRSMDICQVASDIHRQKPLFKINVVLISREAEKLRCVAEITGGKVFTPRTAGEFVSSLQQAGTALQEVCEE